MTDRTSVDDLLVAHAAGRLPEPVGLLVASYVSISPDGRKAYEVYEEIGGSMLELIKPVSMRSANWEHLIADDWSQPADVAPDSARPPMPADLPGPLREYLPCDLENLPWRRFGPMKMWNLPVSGAEYRVQLLQIRAGRGVPRHTHDGTEMLLVIRGGFDDGFDHYARGNLVIADHTVDHRPVADEGEDCLCLTVTDAPARLTGRFARFLNPILRS